jgi:hypothetical protein
MLHCKGYVAYHCHWIWILGKLVCGERSSALAHLSIPAPDTGPSFQLVVANYAITAHGIAIFLLCNDKSFTSRIPKTAWSGIPIQAFLAARCWMVSFTHIFEAPLCPDVPV